MKKTLTEAEIIRSMIQEMEVPPYLQHDKPQTQYEIPPQELERYIDKIYDYEKKFENLLQQAEQNPKQALKAFNDTRSDVGLDLYAELDDLLPTSLHNQLIRYVDDQVGEEEAGIDEPNPRTKAELQKLIQDRITIMKAINDFIDKEYHEIVDHIIDQYDDRDNF